ncbi:MAG TPA: hypothetical protein VMV86_04215, partial [Methanosarcinales archaeon]|nr:hypothetical protein [Methanosarcinales archaeon]
FKAIGAKGAINTALGKGALGWLGGGAASLAVPFAMAGAVSYVVNRGVNESIERQRFMQSISSDVEQYRGSLGFNGLSYQESSQLGHNLGRGMETKGDFFSKGQQAKIHKIGLSNNLISARGKGLDSGSIQQYERNFSELKETTEEVVKLLQTTIEGGMSVIKELQGKGFTSVKQIRQQVLQAKAFGGMTGLGAQNMMQIGAAGAQATQGTPWSARAGAETYQMGAVTASGIAASGPQGAYAVNRVGGVAAAGAAVGRFQMNVLQSGIGTKMTAYAMNADGSENQGRLDALLGGKVGSYGVVTGANQTGYAMGQGGRVMFPHYKEQMLNNMNAEDRARGAQAAFDLWRRGKGGNVEQQAYAFAGQYSNDPREQYMNSRWLMSNKGFAAAHGKRQAQRMGLNAVAINEGPSTIMGAIGEWAYTPVAATGKWVQGASTGISRSFDEVSELGGMAYRGVGRAVDNAFRSGNFISKGSGSARYGDFGVAANRMYGFGPGGGELGARAIAESGPGAITSVRVALNKALDYDAMFKNMNYTQTQYLMERLVTSSIVGGEPWRDGSLLKQIPEQFRGPMRRAMQSDLSGVTAASQGAYANRRSTTAKFDDVSDVYNKELKRLSVSGRSYVTSTVSKARREGVGGNKQSRELYSGLPSWAKDYVDTANAVDAVGDVSYREILNVNIKKLNKKAKRIGGAMLTDVFDTIDEDQRSRFTSLGYNLGGTNTIATLFNLGGAGRTKLRSDIGSVLRKTKIINSLGIRGKEWESDLNKVSAMTRSQLSKEYKLGDDQIDLLQSINLEGDMGLVQESMALSGIHGTIQMKKELEKRQGVLNRYMDYSLQVTKGKGLNEAGKTALEHSIMSGRPLTKDMKTALLNSKSDLQAFADMGTGGSTDIVVDHIKKGTLNNYLNTTEVTKDVFKPIEMLHEAYNTLEVLNSGPKQIVIEDGETKKLRAVDKGYKVKKGEEREVKGGEKEDLAEKTGRERDRLFETSLLGMISQLAQGQGSAPAGVAPPVMNYWNNRWTA